LAYDSNELGPPNVFVVSFPDLVARQQVSTGNGANPRWARDGSELFFWSDKTLMSAPMTSSGGFGAARPLFTLSGSDVGHYDVSLDGQRFLLQLTNPAALPRQVHVMVNWLDELKAKVGN
jgi:hypothetical protein